MVQRFVSGILGMLVIHSIGHCAATDLRVVVQLSGQFTSDPTKIIVDDSPDPFPIPALLGGSFEGSFEYRLDAVGRLSGLRDFPLSATSINVFDNSGAQIHTIVLPTSGERANPFKIGFGNALFALGPSSHTQSGHLLRMPTDIRFTLTSDAFTFDNLAPPTASMLNSASVVFSVNHLAPIVAVDDHAPFSGWNLPITSLSYFAQEVPEPSLTCFLCMTTVIALLRSRSR